MLEVHRLEAVLMHAGSLSAEERVKSRQRELEAIRTELFDKEVNLL